MNDIQPMLMEFILPEDFFERILVVESVAYLPELCRLFPSAEVFAVTADDTIPEMSDYAGLPIEWRILEYRDEPLPFPREFFDAIISDLTLEFVTNPQDIAAGFSMFLKQTGVWLTSFRNIRHWSVLKKLMESHYYGVVSRLYAKFEFENLLYSSFYKEVRMRPVVREAPKELLQRLLDCGFENIHDDLETEFWLVRAARSMPELSLLKSMYTHEERKILSRVLHRIEYEIESEISIETFWNLYDEMQLFTDYTAAFIHETVVHRERFYRMLINGSPKRRETLRELLQSAIGACMNDEDPIWLNKLLNEELAD